MHRHIKESPPPPDEDGLDTPGEIPDDDDADMSPLLKTKATKSEGDREN